MTEKGVRLTDVRISVHAATLFLAVGDYRSVRKYVRQVAQSLIRSEG